jgi:hypothetical protein
MPQDEHLPCDVYRITFPNWSLLHDAAKARLRATLLRQQQAFVGASPNRRGLIGLSELGNTVAGFYVQEDLRQGLEGNSPRDLEQSQQANFEKLFFAIELDQGLVVIQRRKIPGYVSMNYTSMFEAFVFLLTRVMQVADIEILSIRLEKFYRERTQDEMRRIFFAREAVEIDVYDLHSKSISEEVQLSNPDPREEDLYRRIFQQDLASIEQEIIRAAPGKDLRKTKTSKAAIGAGRIRKVVSRLPEGGTDTFFMEQDERIVVPVDDGKQYITREETAALNAIIQRRFREHPLTFTGNDPNSDWGPLFNLRDKL